MIKIRIFVTRLISQVKFFTEENKVKINITGIWTLGHMKAYSPPLSLWWFHVSSQSPERDVEDSGVVNDKEEIDNQNDAEKVKQNVKFKKKKIIYEARCLINFNFCGASASIWLKNNLPFWRPLTVSLRIHTAIYTVWSKCDIVSSPFC